MENNFKNNMYITESPCCAPETLQVNYTLIIYTVREKINRAQMDLCTKQKQAQRTDLCCQVGTWEDDKGQTRSLGVVDINYYI